MKSAGTWLYAETKDDRASVYAGDLSREKSPFSVFRKTILQKRKGESKGAE